MSYRKLMTELYDEVHTPKIIRGERLQKSRSKAEKKARTENKKKFFHDY